MRIITVPAMTGVFTRCMILLMGKVIVSKILPIRICTLEFIPHRELYDWFIEQLDIFPVRQYEFARLNMTYTVMSKRKLLQLVNEGLGRGLGRSANAHYQRFAAPGIYTRKHPVFCDKIGVQKRENLIDLSLLGFCIREDLNKNAIRRMAVLDPVKLVITNYPEGEAEELAR